MHGAGAVRLDTKAEGGPAGEDQERVFNYVRLVRGGDVNEAPDGDPTVSSSEAVVALADSDTSSQPADLAGPGGQQGGPGGQQGPDLASAAAQLGVTEEALQAALGDPSQGPPDFAAAAQALGITESDLIAALGVPADGQLPAVNQPSGSDSQSTDSGNQPPDSGQQPPGPGRQTPDLVAAAAQLGVTEEALQAALGDPRQGPPDFAAVAQALGVTDADLMAALGVPAGGPPPGGQPPTNSP